jgi:small GTP-binding protein
MTIIQKKICLLGDFAVGKTSLVRRYVEGRFDDRYLSTIGVKISRKTLARSYGELNLLVWDLAGSDEFSSQSSYLRGAASALLVCDLTRRDTLPKFTSFAEQLRALNGPVPLVMLGNKADLEAERAITDADLQAVSAALNAPVLLTSAKTGQNVEAAFGQLANLLEAAP